MKGIYLPNRNTLYYEHFPSHWYCKEKKGTGPDECEHCLHNGCVFSLFGPIFVMYCWNCMHHIYKGKRGYNVNINVVPDLISFYKQYDDKYIPLYEPMLLL